MKSSTQLPAYDVAEMNAICARKNAITARIRAVDPVVALEARQSIDPVTFAAALRLAATRRDFYDGLAHVRCLHDAVPVRLEWLDEVLSAPADLVTQLAARADAAILSHAPAIDAFEIFVVWAHACIDDETWEVLRTAKVTLQQARRS